MDKYYIAYGSNLNIGQMKRRYPHSKVFHTGILNNYKLEFRGSKSCGHLTIAKSLKTDEIKEIPIVVWEITKEDEDVLDIYVGYPKYYIKKELEVETERKGTIIAMVYIMNNGFDIQCPLGRYLEICKEGYEQFDFDTFPLYCALTDAVKSKVGEEVYKEAFLKHSINITDGEK